VHGRKEYSDRRMMRRITCLAALAAIWLVACSSGGSHPPVTQSAANASALRAIEDLGRYQAQSASTALITGFTVVADKLTTHTETAFDSQGHVLTVDPAPGKAWVVEITAPPQGIWGSISAVAEVDATSGVVAGSGLWAAPVDAPVKTS
jgi:glucose/arabinose dehydrogenase